MPIVVTLEIMTLNCNGTYYTSSLIITIKTDKISSNQIKALSIHDYSIFFIPLEVFYYYTPGKPVRIKISCLVAHDSNRQSLLAEDYEQCL